MCVSSSINSSSLQLVDLNLIPKLDHPLREIPQYVFENCNQVTCNNYKVEFLSMLREKVKVITKTDLRRMLPNNEAALVKKQEEFDWIYGLDYLESTYLKKDDYLNKPEAFTVEEVIYINGLFSRFSNSNPGKFRDKSVVWSKGDGTPNDVIVRTVLQGKMHQEKGEEWLGELSAVDSPCEPVWIEKTFFRNILLHYQKNPEELQFTTEKAREIFNRGKIDPTIVDQWAEQFGDKKKRKINATKWMQHSQHFFPHHAKIPHLLQDVLNQISSPDMHPIAKASLLWLKIVEIHISFEANKRSGKALASLILLAYGYLPPKIDKVSGSEYVDVMKEALASNDGHIKFTNYIAKKIQETHAEYADQILSKQT